MVKAKINKLNKNNILEKRKGYKKISYHEYVKQPFQLQAYLKTLNITQARLRFKLKTSMTPTVRMNRWTCTGCSDVPDRSGGVIGRRDTQTHIMVCPGYDDLRQDMNLDEDRDLVKYFSMVIKRRLDTDDC